MAFIKFNNKNTIYEVCVIPQSKNVVRIVFENGEVLENDSGFLFSNRHDLSVILGNYSSYKTIYQVTDNELWLSSDGTVYPVISEVEEPTLKERIVQLEIEKEELKSTLEITKDELLSTQEALCEMYELLC